MAIDTYELSIGRDSMVANTLEPPKSADYQNHIILEKIQEYKRIITDAVDNKSRRVWRKIE